MPRRFVTAFAGRRDSYQVPLALAEAGRLERLITSLYAVPRLRGLARLTPPAIRARLLARRHPALPDDRVRVCVAAEVVEHLGRLLRLHPPRYWAVVNDALSWAATREAQRARADLLLYEPYAVRAFAHRYAGFTPRKVLFHFHPHPDYEAAALARDTGFAFDRPAADGGGNYDPHSLAVRQVWRRADLILCASSVTQRSLVAAGARADLCRVIPYGIDAPPDPPSATPPERYRVLFVGSGIQRKGLHHLLAAWRAAALPAGAELVLVCRTIDPALGRAAAATPGCTLRPGVSGAELGGLFRSATLFALPSLLEGFGFAYLEALAHGCPILGTTDTAAPDLGGEADGVFVVPPGDACAVAARLAAAARLVGDVGVRRRAWEVARRFTWERFRRRLVDALA